MVFGLDALSKQIKELQEALRPEAREFNVGVSHAALDEERELNTRIREKIESIIPELQKLKTVDAQHELHNAQRLLKVAAGNTATLRYLESISCLEGIFADITKAVTLTSVELSKTNATSERVLGTRFLAENVEQCWEYISQVSALAASHLRAAADYHQFNHSANEIHQHSKRMLKIAKKCLQVFHPEGRFSEASKLISELEDRLRVFEDLSERCRNLVQTSGSLLQIGNRLLSVRNGRIENEDASGTVLVQALMTFVGSNFTIQKGEILPLIDTTESPYLWKVKTSNGAQYVPSVACLVTSSTDEVRNTAQRTEQDVIESWRAAIDNYKKQLAKYYTKYFQSFNGIQVTNIQAKNRFLDDIDRVLIRENVDEGQLARVFDTLPRKLHSGVNRDGTDDVWNLSDITTLHKPLQCLQEHARKLKMFEELAENLPPRSEDYLTKFSRSAREFSANLENMRYSNDRNKAQLRELYEKVQSWKSDTLTAPTQGMGRLVLSKLTLSSETSGISSDEYTDAGIPQPPSPYGRINLQSISVPRDEFLTDEYSRLSTEIRLNPSTRTYDTVSNIESNLSSEKQVFSGGANLRTTQINTGVSVRRKQPVVKSTTVKDSAPKYVCDVATQILVTKKNRESQTETKSGIVDCNVTCTQKNQMDCTTQIGIQKYSKEQQVESHIISGEIEAQEDRLNGFVQTIPSSKLNIFSTGPPLDLIVSNMGTKPRQNDLQTQILEMPRIQESVNLDMHPGSIYSGGVQTDYGITLIDGKCMSAERHKPQTLKTECKLKSNAMDEMALQTLSNSDQASNPRDFISLNFHAENAKHNADRLPNPNVLSKSTQVGTILTPTCLQVVDATVRDRKLLSTQVGSGNSETLLCPCSINLSSRLSEIGGFQVLDIGEVETINFLTNGRMREAQLNASNDILFGTSQTNDEANFVVCNLTGDKCLCCEKRKALLKKANCQLTIDKNFTETVCPNFPKSNSVIMESDVHLASSDAGHLRGSVKDANFCSSRSTEIDQMEKFERELLTGQETSQCQPCRRVISNVSNFTTATVKDSSCQVGAVLIPTTVQISDMQMDVGESKIANKLHLKSNAIVCPSTVHLRTRLTDNSGINVVDVKDVAEIGIVLGAEKYVASISANMNITGEQSISNELPEKCYLKFKFNDNEDSGYENFLPCITSRSGGLEVYKRVNSNARCTFHIQTDGAISTADNLKQVENISTSRSLVGVEDDRRNQLSMVNESTQVGTVMVPQMLRFGKPKLVVKDQSSAESVGLAIGSIVQPSVVELETKLFDTSGVTIADMHEVQYIGIEVNDEKYIARVETSDMITTGQASFTTAKPLEAQFSHQYHSKSLSADCAGSKLESYMATVPKTTKPLIGEIQTGETLIELAALGDHGRKTRLWISGDVYHEIAPKLDFLDILESAPKADIMSGSIDQGKLQTDKVKLCDVACEALIRPITLEKRLQTN